MEALYKNKMLIGLALLLIVGGLVYRGFRGNVSESESAQVVGQDLVALSERLSAASLSQNVFTMNGYMRLIDFAVPLPQQSFGRVNPFDVLGRD